MINSKALKDFPKRPMMSLCGCPDECNPECGLVAKVLHSIGRFVMFKLYYPVERFYRVTKERTSRSYAYARFGWRNYDFDMACAWDLFEFKLKRLYRCLQNGHAIQESEDMKALLELIKIVRRLSRGRYEDKYYKLHDKRWGKIESETIPNYDENGKITTYTWNSWRTKTKDASDKVKKQERKETKAIWKNAEKDRVRDVKRMGELIVKHGLRFWD